MLEKKERKEVSKLEQIPPGFFEQNDLIERVDFQDLLFDGWRFRNTGIRSCSFTGCKFIGCIFDEMDLQRVVMTHCTFINCVATKSFRYITGQVLTSSFADTDFSYSFIQNVKWERCSFSGVDFDFMKAKSIDFSGSEFEKTSFEGSHIVRGKFLGIPNLKRSLFFDVKLDDCEFDWNDAFIIMAFGDKRYDELYRYAIKPLLEKYEVTPRRVDQYEYHGRITEEILERIITSKVVIAECSATNKNVYFEIGFALGNKKTLILCIDDAANIPFDLKDFPFIVHENSLEKLEEQLDRKLRFSLGLDKDEN